MPGERVAPQSEVIRAIVLEDSPCWGGAHLEVGRRRAVAGGAVQLPVQHRRPRQLRGRLAGHYRLRVLAYSCSRDCP